MHTAASELQGAGSPDTLDVALKGFMGRVEGEDRR